MPLVGGAARAHVNQEPVALARELRAHVDALARAGRCALFVALIGAAAGDVEAGGIVTEAFEDATTVRGSGPALRLFAALHFLVLAGRAPELARYFPTAGGMLSPSQVWPAARRTIDADLAEVRSLLRLPVQTNEPGRAAALFGALLLLGSRHRLPIRLLEIGASAGLNLNAERFHYRVADVSLGDDQSPLRFDEPWRGRPVREPRVAQPLTAVAERAGCDKLPIDPGDEFGRLRLRSYVWPDEVDRLARLDAALEVARRFPIPIAAAAAPDWVSVQLAKRRPGELVVVWQSLVRPSMTQAERDRLEAVLVAAGAETSTEQPLAHVALEASEGERLQLQLVLRTWLGGERELLAHSPIHGPPVTWSTRTQ